MNPSVAIIILNWNNAADTLDCLKSVFELDYPNFNVLVVDNGSADDSVARIRTVYPDVEILETGENLGYAEGNNVGIRRALADGAEDICVLNNDTEVAPSFLSALVGAMEDPRIGIAGPLVYYANPSDMVFSAGCDIDWRDGVARHRGMGATAAGQQSSVLTHSCNVDALAGCGLLVSRAAMERAGLLDPTYFLNFEDIDWCVRIGKCDYGVRYVPEAVMWHKVSATLGQDSPGNTYYMTRNGLRFFSRYGPNRPRALAAILWRTTRTIVAWSVKSAYAHDHYKRHRAAAVQAVSDFIMNKSGPTSTRLKI